MLSFRRDVFLPKVPRHVVILVPLELTAWVVIQQGSGAKELFPRRQPCFLRALLTEDSSSAQFGQQECCNVLERAGVHDVGQVEAVDVGDFDPPLELVRHRGRRPDDLGVHAPQQQVLGDTGFVPLEVLLARHGVGPAVDDRLDHGHLDEAEVFVVRVRRQVDAGPAPEQREGTLSIAVRQKVLVLLFRGFVGLGDTKLFNSRYIFFLRTSGWTSARNICIGQTKDGKKSILQAKAGDPEKKKGGGWRARKRLT